MAGDPIQMPTTDPITTILVTVTEMRGELRSALEQLGRHDTDISQLKATVTADGNRLTALETTVGNLPKRAVPPAAVWSALGLAIAALGVLITFLALKGGG